eukprot:COSAG01_NODE_38_length_33931_cov_75.163632_19_plen_49_part_00
MAVWSQWSQRVNGVIASMGYEVAHGTHAALPPGQVTARKPLHTLPLQL